MYYFKFVNIVYEKIVYKNIVSALQEHKGWNLSNEQNHQLLSTSFWAACKSQQVKNDFQQKVPQDTQWLFTIFCLYLL
jgi:hypothetical protein